MEQKIKTEKVLAAYRILSAAKYGKLDDADKIKVWKIARALKPVATQFEDDSKDAAEKFKPQNYENFDTDLQKAQEYEQKKGVGCEMGIEDYKKFIAAFKLYNEQVGKALKEFAEKKVVVSFTGLSEDAFGKLMASNEWTVEQAIEIGTLIIE